MKKILTLIMVLFTTLSLIACSSGGNTNIKSVSKTSTTDSEPDVKEDDTEQRAANAGDSKALVVYFSHSGNTKAVAKMIQESIGGDAFEIETVDPYPSDYNKLADQAEKELHDNYLPPLSTSIENIDAYDTIFIGYPIWMGTFPQPIASFLTKYDLSGKTVVPFSTTDSGTLGSSVANLKTLVPNAKVLDGLAIRGSSVKNAQGAITDWLSKLGLRNEEKE